MGRPSINIRITFYHVAKITSVPCIIKQYAGIPILVDAAKGKTLGRWKGITSGQRAPKVLAMVEAGLLYWVIANALKWNKNMVMGIVHRHRNSCQKVNSANVNTAIVLNLDTFAQGTPCLSPARASAMAEAAVVCLQHQGHHTGVKLAGEDVQLLWSSLDSRAEMSHQDLQEATEEGATAIAILWVQARTGLQVVRRSRKGPGFDWYLGPNADGPPFAGTHCLEVSGILDDVPPLLAKRLREKLVQIRRGGAGLPGYAVVVGFRTPAAHIGATHDP